ncbi:MAG TPA: hypothetical protein VN381_12055 [Anaerovoracaceae bacterium]|nr:hypothetical protein [Anaerovoracaceae bacterium]
MDEFKLKDRLPGTKYSRPGMNPWLVTRQRLYNKLDAVLSCRLTTVVAPAGYGKNHRRP